MTKKQSLPTGHGEATTPRTSALLRSLFFTLALALAVGSAASGCDTVDPSADGPGPGVDGTVDSAVDSGVDGRTPEAAQFATRTGALRVQCVDDGFEPNDRTSAARAIAVPGQLTAVACPRDADWYAFDAEKGCTIAVGLRFQHAVGDLNLQLLTADGKQVAASYSRTDDETLSAVAPTTGGYHVHVYGLKGASAPYELEVDITCEAPAPPIREDDCSNGLDDDRDGAVDCADGDCAGASACAPPPPPAREDDCANGADDDLDGFVDCADADCDGASVCAPAPPPVDGTGGCEDDVREDNDRSEDAWVLYTPGELAGVVCPDDADWYAFEAEAGCTARVELRFEHAVGDLNLQLKAADGAQVAASYSRTDDEIVVATLAESGRYVLHVYGFQGATNDYMLSVALACPTAPPAREDDCTNGVDDDRDGAVDCDDSDCVDVPACIPPPTTEDNCTNGLDDDRDGAVDCDDADCVDVPACIPSENCTNGLDDDRDGAVDCDDSDCDAAAVCIPPENCTNGLDDDRDGAVDCDDADCVDVPACIPSENCTNGVDDDRDGAVDCDDSDCVDVPACIPSENCTNGLDDDRDGAVDCDDSDCDAATVCIPPPATEDNCTNGLDDDRDGAVDCDDSDCAADTACATPPDTGPWYCPGDDGFEQNDSLDSASTLPLDAAVAAVVCPNDADWYAVDAAAGCVIRGDLRFSNAEGNLHLQLKDDAGGQLAAGYSSTDDELVQGTAPSAGTYYFHVYGFQGAAAAYTFQVTLACGDTEVCANGADDDGDGLVDCDDADCAGHTSCVGSPTQPPTPVELCTGGADEDGDGLVDCDDPDCGADAACVVPAERCTGGADEDGDGLVDCDDPDCDGTLSCAVPETNCADGLDDDGDGLVDCADADCLGTAGCTEQCAAAAVLGCGQTVSGSTVGRPNAVTSWPCGSLDADGPELIYAFTAPQTGSLRLTLSDLTADLDLFVLEGGCASDRCVAASATVDGEALAVDTVAGRTYHVVVDGFRGAAGTFTLRAECAATPAEDCADGSDDDGDGRADCTDAGCIGTAACAGADDALEDNDTPAEAIPAPPSATGLVARGGDDDWYAVDVCAGGTVSVTIRFSTAQGDLDLALTDAAGRELVASFSQTDDETLAWTNASSGPTTVLAVVTAFFGTSNGYDLVVSVTGC